MSPAKPKPASNPPKSIRRPTRPRPPRTSLLDLLAPEWIFETRRDSLRPLLAAHRPFFEGRLELELESDAQHSHDWKFDVHQALVEEATRVPLPLVISMAQVAMATDPEIYRALLNLAALRGLDLGPNAEFFGPTDLALFFRVHHPDLFISVLERRRPDEPRAWLACRAREVPGKSSRSARQKLKELNLLLRKRGLGEECERYLGVEAIEEGDRTRFVLTRVALVRPCPELVGLAWTRHLALPIRLGIDTLTYYPRQQCLEVLARDPDEARFLATAFGQAMHHDPHCYRPVVREPRREAA